MTAQPVFDPARKAAIRELLIETVDAGAPVRRPRRVAFIAALVSVALVLAGGTTALALSGVLRFGTPEDAPAPIPAPTSATPTPTPTPSASSPASLPIVQSAPILPHDVDSLPATPRWSLDLGEAGSGCTGVLSYGLSDGHALYLSGTRPNEYEGSPCANEREEHIGLTLVDTKDGTKLWTREWSFSVEDSLSMTGLEILGTSDRAIIAYEDPRVGPHEVLNLRTGQSLAPFIPSPALRSARTDLVPVNDGSGDIILAKRIIDADGRPTGPDTLLRVDPRDLDHPRWTAQLDGTFESFRKGTGNNAGAPFAFSDSKGYQNAVIELDSGSIRPIDQVTDYMRDALIHLPSGDDSSEMVAYDYTGRVLWSKSVAKGSAIEEVRGAGINPGSIYGNDRVSTGLLTVRDATTLRLIDQTTGDELWSASPAECLGNPFNTYQPSLLDTITDTVIFFGYESSCTFSLSDGSVRGSTRNVTGSAVIGKQNIYSTPLDEASPGAAYRLGTGEQLWTSPRENWESWSYDGGYLVRRNGYHLESMG